MNNNQKPNRLKNKFLFLIFCALFSITNQINAQNFELAGIGSVTYPKSGLKSNDNPAEFSFQEYGAFINIPYKLKNEKTVIVNGLGYGRVESKGFDLPYLNYNTKRNNLNAIYYQLVFAHKLNTDWRLIIGLRPTLASDFKKNLGFQDLVFQGMGFALKQVNADFSIGGGVAYTMRFGKPFAVPVLPINYKKGKHEITAILPVKSSYKYYPGKKEKLSIGIKHFINGALFNISTSDMELQDSPELEKISYSRFNLGVAINYDITKSLRFEIFGGTSARRQYHLIDVSNNTHKFDLKNTPFFQFGIVLLPQKKKG
jgi:hypothetical protein